MEKELLISLLRRDPNKVRVLCIVSGLCKEDVDNVRTSHLWLGAKKIYQESMRSEGNTNVSSPFKDMIANRLGYRTTEDSDFINLQVSGLLRYEDEYGDETIVRLDEMEFRMLLDVAFRDASPDTSSMEDMFMQMLTAGLRKSAPKKDSSTSDLSLEPPKPKAEYDKPDLGLSFRRPSGGGSRGLAAMLPFSLPRG